MWEYMERRARQCAEYILKTGTTVRDCAKHFNISKSTVHTVVMIQNVLYGWFSKPVYRRQKLICTPKVGDFWGAYFYVRRKEF